MRNGVTIGQAAAFVGVTVKTVRPYHKLGPVAEPERDSSGYRRYGCRELPQLVRVRTLAAAGAPLAETGAMLGAGAEQFGAALADVGQQLTARVDELVARRDTLHRLADGDRPAARSRLRDPGPYPRVLLPEGFDGFLVQLEHGLDDPEYIDLPQRGGESETWEPDDPRIEELATAIAARYLANPANRVLSKSAICVCVSTQLRRPVEVGQGLPSSLRGVCSPATRPPTNETGGSGS